MIFATIKSPTHSGTTAFALSPETGTVHRIGERSKVGEPRGFGGHDDHHRIYEAITAREPWQAEMLMREHVSSVKASLVKSLTERNGGQ